jgi:alkylation response protein AidB-like acyl-CoA dehydrogenase
MTGDIAFNEVFLSDARVANDDLLGEQGEGWRIGMTTLSHERDPDNSGSGIGFDFAGADLNRTAGEHAAAVDGDVDGFGLAMSGGANRLLEDILNEFDVSADPVRRQRIRQLAELRLTSRWSTARSVAAVKAGGQPGPEVSTLKVIGAEVSRRTRDLGLEAMGPEGMLWGDDAPTGGQFHAYCMFTPAMSIAGGSDEVNRNIIGERVLGLPREPGESEQRQRPWSELPRN